MKEWQLTYYGHNTASLTSLHCYFFFRRSSCSHHSDRKCFPWPETFFSRQYFGHWLWRCNTNSNSRCTKPCYPAPTRWGEVQEAEHSALNFARWKKHVWPLFSTEVTVLFMQPTRVWREWPYIHQRRDTFTSEVKWSFKMMTIGTHSSPPNTWRNNNNVVITSKWRLLVVITSKWRRFDVITTSLLINVSVGYEVLLISAPRFF